MQQESIYNLIPKEYVAPPKPPVYKSKYPSALPPTGSTFCHKTTSKPGVFNLSGEFGLPPSSHTHIGQAQTMGYLKGQRKPSPQNYRLKRTGTMGDHSLPPVRQYSYDCSYRKEAVPGVNDKPVLGLKSNKNFIVTNAVENILSVPKAPKTEVNWIEKKDYGRVPDYLQHVKSNIQNQYRMIQNLQHDIPEDKHCLSEQQVNELRQGLKKKWQQLNQTYQSITHISKIDTVGLKRKKENCEKEMAEIQKDIKKLNKLYVFVEAE